MGWWRRGRKARWLCCCIDGRADGLASRGVVAQCAVAAGLPVLGAAGAQNRWASICLVVVGWLYRINSRMIKTRSTTMIDQTSSSPPNRNAGGQAKELDMQDGMQLDVGQELARLKRTLQDAQRRIMFRAEVATVKNCRKLVRHLILVLLDGVGGLRQGCATSRLIHIHIAHACNRVVIHS